MQQLQSQRDWLQRSFDQCSDVGEISSLAPEQFDSFEALCSRYARTVDFLVRKVFRALDELEFEAQGTLIDVVNRAHKRGFFDKIDDIKRVRDIRNEIAHEYLDDMLLSLFSDVLESTLVVLEILDRTMLYAKERNLIP